LNEVPDKMDNQLRYLTETQVSEITGFALSTLRNHRFLGRGIRYSKCGRSVRYALSDVIDYMNSKRIETERVGETD
jgi:predicted DNA-binding transcriptional regulator AlpA